MTRDFVDQKCLDHKFQEMNITRTVIDCYFGEIKIPFEVRLSQILKLEYNHGKSGRSISMGKPL